MDSNPLWPPCLDPGRLALLGSYGISLPSQVKGLFCRTASRQRFVALLGLTPGEEAALLAWLVAQGLDPDEAPLVGAHQPAFDDGEAR
jgi:hypothetical protein